MITITAAELQNHFGKWRERAQREPVSITHHGRETLVMVSSEEYQRLKQYDAQEAPLTEDEKNLIEARMDIHRHTLEKLAR
jgi:prevent-host-death family protein